MPITPATRRRARARVETIAIKTEALPHEIAMKAAIEGRRACAETGATTAAETGTTTAAEIGTTTGEEIGITTAGQIGTTSVVMIAIGDAGKGSATGITAAKIGRDRAYTSILVGRGFTGTNGIGPRGIAIDRSSMWMPAGAGAAVSPVSISAPSIATAFATLRLAEP